MDGTFNATAIYEADRAPVIEAITKPGSKARSEQGALSVREFILVGRPVWPKGKQAKAK